MNMTSVENTFFSLLLGAQAPLKRLNAWSVSLKYGNIRVLTEKTHFLCSEVDLEKFLRILTETSYYSSKY